jgi:hypothetical protein
MTTVAGRRLAKLEGALRPREAVLAWLAEAQQFAGMPEYGRAIAEVPVEAAPLSVIVRRVDAAVRDDMRGQPRDAIEERVRRATGDALFLFTLVFVLNIEAIEIAKVEGLRAAAVFFWMGCLLGGPRETDLAPDEVAEHAREFASAWALWRSVVDRLDFDVRVANEARATLERQHYGGHDVLFADAAKAWAEHGELVRLLTGIAEIMPVTSHGRARQRPPGGTDTGAVEARVEGRVRTLADDARVRAYEVLGERLKAVAIMERRLMADAEPATSLAGMS